jgi:palmitoyltransferase ZDHHC13/17
MTTLEVSNLGRYGFMGGRGGASLSGQMGHRHSHHLGEDSPIMDASAGGGGMHSVHTHRHSGVCAGCGSGFLMNLLGLDRFTKGKAVDGMALAVKATNPFDLGVIGNCKDFWTAGKELGVEYDKLYDVPTEGFKEAKRKRMREDLEEGHGLGARKGVRKTLFMGLGIGGSRRAGYEPVSQEV